MKKKLHFFPRLNSKKMLLKIEEVVLASYVGGLVTFRLPRLAIICPKQTTFTIHLEQTIVSWTFFSLFLPGNRLLFGKDCLHTKGPHPTRRAIQMMANILESVFQSSCDFTMECIDSFKIIHWKQIAFAKIAREEYGTAYPFYSICEPIRGAAAPKNKINDKPSGFGQNGNELIQIVNIRWINQRHVSRQSLLEYIKKGLCMQVSSVGQQWIIIQQRFVPIDRANAHNISAHEYNLPLPAICSSHFFYSLAIVQYDYRLRYTMIYEFRSKAG